MDRRSGDDEPPAKRSSSWGLNLIDQLFYQYANKSSKTIEPDGILSLCSDLQIDHKDIRILLLSWKVKARRQGYFTQDEWRTGLLELRAYTLGSLKMALLGLEGQVRRRQSDWGDFYSYAFRISLGEGFNTLDVESVCDLLEIVLKSDYLPQVNALIYYLEKIQTDYRVITRDQWLGFYRFCSEINFPELDNYDSNDAWPSILDEFVEWMNSEQDSPDDFQTQKVRNAS